MNRFGVLVLIGLIALVALIVIRKRLHIKNTIAMLF
jgi:hypothetical protein